MISPQRIESLRRIRKAEAEVEKALSRLYIAMKKLDECKDADNMLNPVWRRLNGK